MGERIVVPIKYVSESEVRVMINDTLRSWERDYGDVRHKENTEKFEALFSLINRAKGAIWAVGGLFTLVCVIPACTAVSSAAIWAAISGERLVCCLRTPITPVSVPRAVMTSC